MKGAVKMRTSDIDINGTKFNVYLTDKVNGVYASLTPDLENEWEAIGWGETEEEAKGKLKSILERN